MSMENGKGKKGCLNKYELDGTYSHLILFQYCGLEDLRNFVGYVNLYPQFSVLLSARPARCAGQSQLLAA